MVALSFVLLAVLQNTLLMKVSIVLLEAVLVSVLFSFSVLCWACGIVVVVLILILVAVAIVVILIVGIVIRAAGSVGCVACLPMMVCRTVFLHLILASSLSHCRCIRCHYCGL